MAKSNEFRTAEREERPRPRGREFGNGHERQAFSDANDGGEAAIGNQHNATGPLAMVERNPFSTVMGAFGLGLGFGLAVTVLVMRREPSWYERNISEPFQHLPEKFRHVPDSLGSYVPSAWKRW